MIKKKKRKACFTGGWSSEQSYDIELAHQKITHDTELANQKITHDIELANQKITLTEGVVRNVFV